MVVNFTFFGDEPIENVITCLHFRIDKQIYYCYNDVPQNKRNSTANFLTEYCGVKKVEFHELSRINLPHNLKTMKREIEKEKSKGSRLFFDITSGESLLLVAFGRLSEELGAPIHLYDVAADKLIELDEGAKDSISVDAEPQKVQLDLDMYIKLRGGIINYELQKESKGDLSGTYVQDVGKIWQVAREFLRTWNPFSDLCNRMASKDSLLISLETEALVKDLAKSTSKLKTLEDFDLIVQALADRGILVNLKRDDSVYQFEFKDETMKECIREGGSILELHTYWDQKKKSDDCMVGVHLDWDGIITRDKDVLNEIDVLSISGNIPTFISCKSGNMLDGKALHALYELDAVADRFGGKYAKKLLVTMTGLSDADKRRADEMGIEVM